MGEDETVGYTLEELIEMRSTISIWPLTEKTEQMIAKLDEVILAMINDLSKD